MLQKIKYFLLSLSVLFLAGCEDFLDVNEDKDQPSESTPNFLLTPIQGLMAINCYEQGETSAYFAQQVATLSGFSSVKDRWDYSSVTRVGLFRRHFHDVASNAKNLIETAAEEGSKNYEGAGRVMMVLSTQTATDLFGQMPYTEALVGNPSPPYDDQSVIYESMLTEINLAITLLSESEETDRYMGSDEDTMFQGDVTAWLSFAHAIKARILLHLTPNINQDYQPILDEIELALDGWKDPLFQYLTGSTSPWEQNQWGPTRARPEWDYVPNILGESAPTPFLLESVLGYDHVQDTVYEFSQDTIPDPRMTLMMTGDTIILVPQDTIIVTEDDTELMEQDTSLMVGDTLLIDPVLGVEYLTVAPSEGKLTLREEEEYPDLYDTYLTSDDSAQPFMTLEELMFIKAEAAFQSGNLGLAFTAFQSGIRLHMERVGVEAEDITAFLASDMVPSNAGELELSDIMMQKWLALYLQAEAWVDMRRYHYDPLIYKGLIRPQNLAAFWSDDETEWIQRLPYDNQTEEIYNKPELERLGAFQNPDWLKVPLWWTGK
ncbi:MAG: SusD/RagB family nutrient-binding outer membrane lipoprotein [Cyclobacteriaceae bacterium]